MDVIKEIVQDIKEFFLDPYIQYNIIGFVIVFILLFQGVK